MRVRPSPGFNYSLTDELQDDFCHSRFLGRRPQHNLEELVGKLKLPSEAPISLEMKDINLFGEESIWGRSLVLEGPSKERICATILPDVAEDKIRIAEARFSSPVAGSVYFHSLSLGDKIETKIFSNLYHVVASTSTDHPWQIFITDILGSNKRRQTCNFLQILYDPDNRDNDNCSKSNPTGCKDGDLTAKFGKVRVGKQGTEQLSRDLSRHHLAVYDNLIQIKGILKLKKIILIQFFDLTI